MTQQPPISRYAFFSDFEVLEQAQRFLGGVLLGVFADGRARLTGQLTESGHLNVIMLFGDLKLSVPAELNIDLEVVQLFCDMTSGDAQPLPGAPTLHIGGFCLFGDLRVSREAADPAGLEAP